MTTIREQLEESQKVCDAATEGPWERSSAYPRNVISATTNQILGREPLLESINGANVDFIAHARTALPLRNAQLAAVLEACEAFMNVAEATGAHPMAKAAHRRCAEDIRRAIEDAAP